MGRRRFRKDGYRQKRDSSDANSNSSAKSRQRYGNGLSTKDRKLASRYLNEYREKCLELYTGTRKPRKRYISDSNSPVVIAGCVFPMLTNAVLLQPYLALPMDLTGKQRKYIHELCVYANLYHAGAGLTKDERFIAISIYSDGLSHVPHMTSDPATSFLKFKPWFCRKTFAGISTVEATKHGHDAIYRFVDQPGECLRDGIDFLDMKDVEKEDLSKTVPPVLDEPTWMLVDSPEKMRQCIQEIEGADATEIAFDLESYNKSKFQQLTCLIQLASSQGKEYVIDTLAPGVWNSVNGLAPIFANPKIVKIGHAIGGMDVQSLHRDFGIFVVNAFDTHEAARSLKMPGKGLAAVCASYNLPNSKVYAELKESYQNTDWTRRPLDESMIMYGRCDVHYLIQLRRLMMRDLAKPELSYRSNPKAEEEEAVLVAESLASMMSQFGEDEYADAQSKVAIATCLAATPGHAQESLPTKEQDVECKSLFNAVELRMNAALMQVVSRSQQICLKLWKEQIESHLNNPEFKAMMVRSQHSDFDMWTLSQLELYSELAKWREETGRREECSVGFVCPMGFLALIALKRPTSRTGLLQLSYKLPEFFEINYVPDLFELVRKSRIADGLDESGDYEFPCYEDFLERQERRRKETLAFCQSLVLTASAGAVVIALFANFPRGKR